MLSRPSLNTPTPERHWKSKHGTGKFLSYLPMLKHWIIPFIVIIKIIIGLSFNRDGWHFYDMLADVAMLG